mgnify:CR=1 FL=1
MDWFWWIFENLPFAHLVRILDCFLHEGIKVLYRIALAILLLFHKYSSPANSKWMTEIHKSGMEVTLYKFCKEIPVGWIFWIFFFFWVYKKEGNKQFFFKSFEIYQVSPSKVLRTAFSIRALSSVYISKVFLRTEMLLKSRNVLTGSRQLSRSRSSDNLPTSQSQVNIQMMSHTLTIREVNFEYKTFS